MHVSFVSNSIRRKKFEQIVEFLHCVDNKNIGNNVYQSRTYLQHLISVHNFSYDESIKETWLYAKN